MKKRRFSRRTFVQTFPAALVAASSLDVHAQQPQAPQTPQRITKEMLHTAEQIMGLDFTDEQETQALRGVNGNLTSYENLRKIEVPLDTEPATAFHPALPGKKFNRTKTKAAPDTSWSVRSK